MDDRLNISSLIRRLEDIRREFVEVSSKHARRYMMEPCIYEYYGYENLLEGKLGTCTSSALIRYDGSRKVLRLVLTDIGTEIGDKVDAKITTIVVAIPLMIQNPKAILPLTTTSVTAFRELEVRSIVHGDVSVDSLPLILDSYYNVYLRQLVEYVNGRLTSVNIKERTVTVSGLTFTFIPFKVGSPSIYSLLKELYEFTEACVKKLVKYKGAVEVIGKISSSLLA